MKPTQGICQVIKTQAGFLRCLSAPAHTPSYLSLLPKSEILLLFSPPPPQNSSPPPPPLLAECVRTRRLESKGSRQVTKLARVKHLALCSQPFRVLQIHQSSWKNEKLYWVPASPNRSSQRLNALHNSAFENRASDRQGCLCSTPAGNLEKTERNKSKQSAISLRG